MVLEQIIHVGQQMRVAIGQADGFVGGRSTGQIQGRSLTLLLFIRVVQGAIRTAAVAPAALEEIPVRELAKIADGSVRRVTVSIG